MKFYFDLCFIFNYFEMKLCFKHPLLNNQVSCIVKQSELQHAKLYQQGYTIWFFKN